MADRRATSTQGTEPTTRARTDERAVPERDARTRRDQATTRADEATTRADEPTTRADEPTTRTDERTAPESETRHRRSDDPEFDRGATAWPGRAGAAPPGAAGRGSAWGPVLSGAAIAFVVFLVMSALWLAIAASGVPAVGENLQWFQLATAVLAAAAGGATAGWLDPRGATVGAIQGLATWGLLLFVVAVAGIATGTALMAGVAELTLQAPLQQIAITEQLQPFAAELWALFAVLLGGAAIATAAGAGTGRAHTTLALEQEPRTDFRTR